jgi:copper chaperone
MENTNFQFKTNINCSGCEAKVTPFLDETKSVWKVDTTNKDKVLTVKSDNITKQQVIEAVEKAGFKIEPLN